MKKYLMAGVLVSLLLSCTACGKKLTCTGDMMGMDAEVVTKFSGDKASSISMQFTVDLKDLGLEEDVSNDEMDEAVEEIKKEFEDMGAYENVKVTSKGSTITVKCDYKVTEDDEERSYDETKEYFEKDMGLTCK